MGHSERLPVGAKVTIYPRGKKRIYCADFWRDGQHCRMSLRTTNKKVAVTKAQRLEAQLASGDYQPPVTAVALRQAVDDYIEHLKTEDRSRRTTVKYSGILANLLDFLSERDIARLGQFTAAHFDKFRASRR